MNNLINNKVKYKIFDRDFKESSHFYSYNNEVSDDEVDKNRQIIMGYCNANHLYTVTQIHGADIVVINELVDDRVEKEADAIVTNLNQVAIAVKTADCVPVLLSSSCGNVIAAIHCSSKCVRAGIIVKTIKKMHELQEFNDIKAIIGPSIKQYSYEVGESFYEDFLNETESNSIFFSPKAGEKYLFDLPAYVISKLKEFDIDIDYISDDDTFSNPKKYSSHRFSSKKGEKYKGSILSVIMKCI